MNAHVLRTDARWWDRIADGSKTAELRKHDRDFQIGDRLILMREPDNGFLGRPASITVIEATVSHVLPASVYPEGLQVGYSLLSLTDVGCRREVPEGQEIIPAGGAA